MYFVLLKNLREIVISKVKLDFQWFLVISEQVYKISKGVIPLIPLGNDKMN